jgi:hypothetical protein
MVDVAVTDIINRPEGSLDSEIVAAAHLVF